jgi:hypothetical protein
MTIADIQEQLKNLLNPNTWSLDSTEGIITLVLTVFLIYAIKEKASKFIMWCIGGLLLIQIFYLLSLTNLNNYIPFGTIFKYDMFASLAQLCVGTKLSDGLLWCDAWLRHILELVGTYVTDVLDKMSILH